MNRNQTMDSTNEESRKEDAGKTTDGQNGEHNDKARKKGDKDDTVLGDINDDPKEKKPR